MFGPSAFVKSVMVNCFVPVMLILIQERLGWQSKHANPDAPPGILSAVASCLAKEGFVRQPVGLGAPTFDEDEVLIGVDEARGDSDGDGGLGGRLDGVARISAGGCIESEGSVDEKDHTFCSCSPTTMYPL